MPPVLRPQLDYYAVLEITRAADVTEVNAAFRRLAWRYHPDHNHAPGATLQFQDINEAHQVLTDSIRRAEYDAKWHPRTSEHRRATRAQIRHRSRHHGWHRPRHVKPVLTALFSLLFISTAWTVIFAAMTSARSGSSGVSVAETSPITTSASLDCGYSMEMFPVTLTDQHGRPVTVWQTDVRNCWGGFRVSGLPALMPQRVFADRTAYR
ncbi:MAG TPA: J domain-containing protein [Terriglobales bacterium]|nr:J domain-containing protein [Terriglobales bacterium]